MSVQLARSTAYSHAPFVPAKTVFHFWCAESVRSGHQASTSRACASGIEAGSSWRSNHACAPPACSSCWNVRGLKPNDILLIIWRANGVGTAVLAYGRTEDARGVIRADTITNSELSTTRSQTES